MNWRLGREDEQAIFVILLHPFFYPSAKSCLRLPPHLHALTLFNERLTGCFFVGTHFVCTIYRHKSPGVVWVCHISNANTFVAWRCEFDTLVFLAMCVLLRNFGIFTIEQRSSRVSKWRNPIRTKDYRSNSIMFRTPIV